MDEFVSRHGFAFSPPTILEQQAQEQRVLEVLDSLWRLLDSPQRILSHVRLDSTHGTSRTAMPADERKRRRAAAEKARRVRLRQAVSAAETAAAQNEPLTDEQQRVLATPAPHAAHAITSSLLSALCCATATRAAAATGMVVCVWQEVGISAAGPGGGFYATPRLQSALAMALFL